MRIIILGFLLFTLYSCQLETVKTSSEYERVCTLMGYSDSITFLVDLKSSIEPGDIRVLVNNTDFNINTYEPGYDSYLSVDNLQLKVVLQTLQSEFPKSAHFEILSKSTDRIIVSDIYNLNWSVVDEPNGEGCGYRYRSELRESE